MSLLGAHTPPPYLMARLKPLTNGRITDEDLYSLLCSVSALLEKDKNSKEKAWFEKIHATLNELKERRAAEPAPLPDTFTCSMCGHVNPAQKVVHMPGVIVCAGCVSEAVKILQEKGAL